jgi:DHA1 family multidrug resistance protein-like MFS transporter
MVVLVAVCALSAAGSLLSARIWLYILYSVLVYAGYSVSIPVLQNMVASQAVPGQKNLVMGFYNATKSLGSVIGSLTAGFIYAVHVKLPFLCITLVYGIGVLVALAYLIYSTRRYKAN